MLAASADQAIYSIEAVKPDVILLDVRLPGIKGLAVARQSREDLATHDLPIIAITAFSEKDGRDEPMSADTRNQEPSDSGLRSLGILRGSMEKDKYVASNDSPHLPFNSQVQTHSSSGVVITLASASQAKPPLSS